VADDLSGAADCGIACAASGLQTTVLLDWRHGHQIGADAIAVDADSRRMNPASAAAITEQIVREHVRGPRQLLYKKLDSTLRGNVGAELAAALNAFRDLRAARAGGFRGVAVVAPAFPKSGRTTVAGRQFLNGTPLEETEIWRREGMSGRAYLSEILRSSGMHAELVALDIVRSGPELLCSKMTELRKSADALVCDAETDEDLYSIATASVSLGPDIMWSGSAGLAHHLPQAAGITGAGCAILDYQAPVIGPILFVVGSLSSVSQQQVKTLACDVRSVCVSPGVLRAGRESPEWCVHEREIRESMKSGNDVVVHLDREANVDLAQGRLLSRALAKLVAPCANEAGGLVLTGGETAREVLDALGVTRLRLVGELEPGLPFSVTDGWKRKLPVFTKAGDFGHSQSLVHCRQSLRQLDPNRTSANVP